MTPKEKLETLDSLLGDEIIRHLRQLQDLDAQINALDARMKTSKNELENQRLVCRSDIAHKLGAVRHHLMYQRDNTSEGEAAE